MYYNRYETVRTGWSYNWRMQRLRHQIRQKMTDDAKMMQK